jgi:hypothetical protein
MSLKDNFIAEIMRINGTWKRTLNVKKEEMDIESIARILHTKNNKTTTPLIRV